MALTGHLSDLSLSELIEFFCNQRKTGQLKVLYPQGHGFFYLQTGSVVDARIGVLRGIDAVYFALTLPNAKFEFGGSDEPIERTINQPWTQVVLEGLRRLDEGVVPAPAFPQDYVEQNDTPDSNQPEPDLTDIEKLRVPTFLSFSNKESMGKRKVLISGAVAVVVLASVAAIGVPAGWYGRSASSTVASQPSDPPTNPVAADPPSSTNTTTELPNQEAAQTAETPVQSNEAALAAKRIRDKERAGARAAHLNQPLPGSGSSSAAPTNVVVDSAKPGPKKVAVTVTYDESGRVIQASGGDASAVRIARQKRFPAGKAGSATITIPIN
ncbi:MAG: DUF4388 domain-containing protein [bacterium]